MAAASANGLGNGTPGLGAVASTASLGLSASTFQVSELRIEDVEQFLALQDRFAQEHFELSNSLYGSLTTRDWSLNLIGPARLLDDPGGRVRHAVSMIRREDECFKRISIFKIVEVSSHSNGLLGNGFLPASQEISGYILFQLVPPPKRKPKAEATPTSQSRRRPRNPVASKPAMELKQIYVREEARRRGCGRLLVQRMQEDALRHRCAELRLSVFELNEGATKWYRSLGFRPAGIYQDHLGAKELAQVVAFLDLRRSCQPSSDPASLATRPTFFKEEITGEVMEIDYPDGSGLFIVKVVAYEANTRWHHVDSDGLSLWDNESFTDVVDVNLYFREGFIKFHRKLSELFQQLELRRREAKKRAAEADEQAKRQKC